MTSSVPVSPAPPTSIVTTDGLLQPSILITSSTSSVDSFLTHEACPQNPRSVSSISRGFSTIRELVASEAFLSSAESSFSTARILLSHSM